MSNDQQESQNIESIPDKNTETNLSILNRGLLIANIQKELEETCYSAIDRITKNRSVVQRRQQYCSDIERTINEARLTTNFMMEVDKEKEIGNKTFYPEDIILYYNGVFLDQVHQIKDKIFRLVDRILLVPENSQENKKKDPKKLKGSSFLSSNEVKLKEIDIFFLLKEWTVGGIKVALDKRTNHHHSVSTLPLNEDFQKIKMSRSMLDPNTSIRLSEFGVTKMKEIEENSFKKWRDGVIDKQNSTLEKIEMNIEQISEKLISYYKLPIQPKEVAEIVNRYTTFLSSQDIENKSNINKVSSIIKKILDDFIIFVGKTAKDKISSIYLVGSCGRGEFKRGCSMVDLYVITNGNEFNSFTLDYAKPINITFMSETDFLSKNRIKDRFICWSDGIHLYGKKFDFDSKEFPKPGSFLCILLNKGFIEKLEKIKDEVSKLNNPSKNILREYSLKVAKIILDFDFGVAMANKPFYSPSRNEKILYTKEVFPDHRRTNTLEQIYLDGAIKQSDFPLLIDSFLEKAKINYQKLLDVEKQNNL